jgi:hypothetical protein
MEEQGKSAMVAVKKHNNGRTMKICTGGNKQT